MMNIDNPSRRRAHIFRGILALLIAVSVMSLSGPTAYALNAGCRSDPTIILSNGTVLDVSADIAAPLWDVTGVTYTVHIPAGLSVIAAISTPNWPTTLETLQIIADKPAGRYTTDTVVSTTDQGVDVTANTALVSVLHLVLAAASTSGQDGDNLVINLGR